MHTQLNKKTSWQNDGDCVLKKDEPGYDIKNKIVTLIASTFNLSANKIFVVGSQVYFVCFANIYVAYEKKKFRRRIL